MAKYENHPSSFPQQEFDAILEKYLTQVDSGVQVDQQKFILENNEFGTELREYFDAEEKVGKLAGPKIQD